MCIRDRIEEDLRKLNIRKPEHATGKNGVDSWSRPRPTKGCRAIADDDNDLLIVPAQTLFNLLDTILEKQTKRVFLEKQTDTAML